MSAMSLVIRFEAIQITNIEARTLAVRAQPRESMLRFLNAYADTRCGPLSALRQTIT